ncbi:MAG TPA: hypothetical protein VJV79_11320, partial [Polyangiaceae bacterium]|nr:hypothetical protein [Polyangiaceae bacterium]
RALAQGSWGRRLATRAVVVLGAVVVGGQLMRAVPREQTLIFPVGSVFPNATRFAASWKQPGDDEPRGGVSLTFEKAPPLQIRQRTKLPDGDYIVTIDILQPPPTGEGETNKTEPTGQAPETSRSHEGLQTNFERRVSLAGGEALIALAVVPGEPSVSE